VAVVRNTIYTSNLAQEPQVMVACTICKQQIRMVKKNEQAKVHVESKHSGKAFDVGGFV